MTKIFEEPIRIPRIEHNEQLERVDFYNIATMPFFALRNALSVIFGNKTGKIDGLDLSLSEGKVYCSVGRGIITRLSEVDTTGNTIEGSFIVHVDKKTELFDMPTIANGQTIAVYLTFEIDETDYELRNFKRADGTKEARQQQTTWTYTYGSGYEIVSPVPSSSEINPKLVIGTIKREGNTFVVTNKNYIMNIFQHSNSMPIDHPDRSIFPKHLDTSIVGDFVGGRDLNLQQISQVLISLRGAMNTANERIKGVIDEDGNIVYESVSDIVDQLVQEYLGSLTDGRGSVSQDAVQAATDEQGRPLFNRILVRHGVVDGDAGRLHPPEGASSAQTIHMVSINRVLFPAYNGAEVELKCTVTDSGVVTCYAKSDTRKTYGTANFISIAIIPKQK